MKLVKTKRKKIRLKLDSGQARPKKKKANPVFWALGILGAAGILYFTFHRPETQALREMATTAWGGGAGAQNQAVTSSKKLVFSPLPLTVENDINAIYNGAGGPPPDGIYEWERNGVIIPGEQSPKLTKGQFKFKKGDTLTVRLLFNGGKESESSEPAVVENAPPKITAVKLEQEKPTRRETLTVKVEASDPDGDPVNFAYRWMKEDGTVVGSEASVSGAAYSKKDKIIVEVTPSDGSAEGKPVKAEGILYNALPKITSSPPAISGKEYSYQVTAEDPDSESVTFSLSKGPAGMTIHPKSGVINWPFTEKDAGSHPVEIRVSDSDGEGDVQSFDLPLNFTRVGAGAPPPGSEAKTEK